MREHLVMSPIGSRDIARVQRPDIRRFEHFLQLLDLVDDTFNVHGSPSSNTTTKSVNAFHQFGGRQRKKIPRPAFAGRASGLGRFDSRRPVL